MAATSSSSHLARGREAVENQATPEISRKVTACAACRKMKIKCHMRNERPPCSRCKKRGLSCTLNRSLQMILEGDTQWKDEINGKVQRLENTMSKIVDHLSMSEHMNVTVLDAVEGNYRDGASQVTANQSDASVTNRESPEVLNIVIDDDSGPAAIPGSVMSTVPKPRASGQPQSLDMIARHVVTLDQAESFLQIYQNRLDHFLYRILGEWRDLEGIRKSSPVLLAAICAVGSLHLSSPDFDKCYNEFVSVAASQTFTRGSTIDDVRGLCIGAFWLSGISWICTGAAVRLSTELQLHRSIFKALSGDRTHYLRTRLYYLVYTCDHHFSIVYGRPPMTREDEAILASSEFLRSANAVEDDRRLVSQVHLWMVVSDAYFTFGINVERPLSIGMVEALRRYTNKLDVIRADWSEAFSRNQYVGNYPRKGIGLHNHFVKLYLYSMAFRGIDQPDFKSPEVALDIDELANAALLSATAILNSVASDSEIQSYLNGLPTYFDLMIAFAVVFVVKVSTKFTQLVRVDVNNARKLVLDLARVLKTVTSTMHSRHMLASVSHGIEQLLRNFDAKDSSTYDQAHHSDLLAFGEGQVDLANSWGENITENFPLQQFDFLSTQDPMLFQPAEQYFTFPGP